MAQVTYNGPGLSLSVPVRKRAAERGKAFVCLDPKELEYFRKHPDFSIIEPPKKKATAVTEPTPEPEPAIPPPARRARRAARLVGGDDGQS